MGTPTLRVPTWQPAHLRWDTTANTVTFQIPALHLAAEGIESPFAVGGRANVGALTNGVTDDFAPTTRPPCRSVLPPLPASASALPEVPFSSRAETVTFENAGRQHLLHENSTFGIAGWRSHVRPQRRRPERRELRSELDQTPCGGSDLDLYVTGAADSGSTGATTTAPENVALENVRGDLTLRVDPYFVTDPLSGSTYTLTATITPDEVIPVDTDADGILDVDDVCPNDAGIAPTGRPDTDGDGVIDLNDACPSEAGESANGCPIRPIEFVKLWVGGGLAATQAVDTRSGPDTFVLPVALAEGTFQVTGRLGVQGTGAFQSVPHAHPRFGRRQRRGQQRPRPLPGFDDFDDTDRDGVPDGCDTDSDGDGAADHRDNCLDLPNPDQANLDGDKKGDACDSDIDGDGHSNGKERAHGTNERDPSSYPGKPKTGLGI